MTGQLRQFVADNADALLNKSGVESVGVGKDPNGRDVVVVGVQNKDQMSTQMRSEINSVFPQDVPHVVREAGPYEAELLKAQADPTGKFRPVIQGVSCGHPDVTAGTTGLVYENDAGETFVGSNNHVLADVNRGVVGDDQLQPGTADGGSTQNDVFGTLAYYKAIENNVTVDLAVARAVSAVENTVNDINQPVAGSVSSVDIGDTVIKSGRTTGITTGTVEQVSASVSVGYGGGQSFTIDDCIITSDMSDGGDSGSATFVEQSDGLYVAGRLFAGSDTATVHHAYRNEIATLQNSFDASITLVTDGGGAVNPTAEVNLVLTQTQAEQGNIQVVVEDDSAVPLADATVSISGPVSDSSVTGEQGLVTFFDVPIGSYTVSAEKEGYESASASITSTDFV